MKLLIILIIALLLCLSGCCQQHTTATFTSKAGNSVSINCESATFLKDLNASIDPNTNAFTIKSESTSPVDAALAGLGFIAGILIGR